MGEDIVDGDEDVVEEVLPKRRWVDSVSISCVSRLHHGHTSLRDSHPSSFSLSGQLARLRSWLHDRTNSYHRWLHGCVDTLRFATHMSPTCCVPGVSVVSRLTMISKSWASGQKKEVSLCRVSWV